MLIIGLDPKCKKNLFFVNHSTRLQYEQSTNKALNGQSLKQLCIRSPTTGIHCLIYFPTEANSTAIYCLSSHICIKIYTITLRMPVYRESVFGLRGRFTCAWFIFKIYWRLNVLLGGGQFEGYLCWILKLYHNMFQPM